MNYKEVLKSSLLYPLFNKVRDSILHHRRKKYFSILRKYIHPTTSIISSNCFAGRVMQDLGMQYNSPTLGLYFFAPDYLEFVSNLRYYLTDAKLDFVDSSKYELGNKRRAEWPHWYPIGVLGGKVEIEFLHYYTEEEAAKKWYRRAARVNWNDIVIIGMEQNLCKDQLVRDFDKLPFEKKVFFSTKAFNLQSVVAIKEFANKSDVGDPYKKGHVFYKYLVNYFNNTK